MNDPVSADPRSRPPPSTTRAVGFIDEDIVRPERNTFTHEIVVSSSDIDRYGHANNVVVLGWIQDVAEAHSDSVGYSVAEYQRLGAAFIVRRHEVDYLRPSMLGERLSLRTWVPSTKRISCCRGTEITSVDSGHVIARAMTTWVYAELATMRLARIPDEILTAFGYGARSIA